VAIASLDERNEASYTFYKPYPEKRLFRKFPELTSDDILLFGSFYSITPEIRPQIAGFVCSAKDRGALIIYDPNIRSNHSKDIEGLRHLIDENIQMADIIRASSEDLENIYGTIDEEIWKDRIAREGKILILTRGDKEISAFHRGREIKKATESIEPVSTIGAGDSFNAGLIYGIYRDDLGRDKLKGLPDDQLLELLGPGQLFAANCCLSLENYVDNHFASGLKSSQ
jgi:fructokinase